MSPVIIFCDIAIKLNSFLLLVRLPGKKGKEKDADSKSQAVGNINRLICASKHQNSLLQGTEHAVYLISILCKHMMFAFCVSMESVSAGKLSGTVRFISFTLRTIFLGRG